MILFCVRKINALKYTPKIIECRDYRNYSPEESCKSLSQINWDPVRNASDDALDFFFHVNDKIQRDRHAPMIQKKVKGVNYPARQQRDCVLQKPRRTYKEMDWSTFRRLRNARSAKANYNRNLIQENIDESKSFWRAVKRILPNDKKLKQSVFSIKIDGNLKTDKNAIKCQKCHVLITSSPQLSRPSVTSYLKDRQQSTLQNSTEAPFTNETFQLSLVRPNVVYNL